MTLVLELSPVEEQELSNCAAREGVSLSEYARRRLVTSIHSHDAIVGKPFNIMSFAAAAPRPSDEITAHVADIEDGRNERDNRDWPPRA
jgi:hypothetical protein